MNQDKRLLEKLMSSLIILGMACTRESRELSVKRVHKTAKTSKTAEQFKSYVLAKKVVNR